MARLRVAPVTALAVIVGMMFSCCSRVCVRGFGATMLPHRHGRLMLRRLLAGGLRLLARGAQYGVGLALERGEIDLHPVEHSAPVPRDRRHRHRLTDLLVARAVGLGDGAAEVDA